MKNVNFKQVSIQRRYFNTDVTGEWLVTDKFGNDLGEMIELTFSDTEKQFKYLSTEKQGLYTYTMHCDLNNAMAEMDQFLIKHVAVYDGNGRNVAHTSIYNLEKWQELAESSNGDIVVKVVSDIDIVAEKVAELPACTCIFTHYSENDLRIFVFSSEEKAVQTRVSMIRNVVSERGMDFFSSAVENLGSGIVRYGNDLYTISKAEIDEYDDSID